VRQGCCGGLVVGVEGHGYTCPGARA
jgi:hypothetical protein